MCAKDLFGGTAFVKLILIMFISSTGSHIDPYTAVQSIPMSPPLGERKVLQSLPTNYPQPDFDDADESAVSSRLGHDGSGDIDDAESVASENDACSLNEYVGSGKKSKPSKRYATKSVSNKSFPSSGPCCSKLTMSLVNDLLKFTSSDTQIC